MTVPPAPHAAPDASNASNASDALTPVQEIEQACREARLVAPTVAALPTGVKNDLLIDLADALLNESDVILDANLRDVEAAERRRLPEAEIDRFTLTHSRLGMIAEGVRAVAALPDPVGEVLRGSRRPNGLVVQEVRVPMGVVGMMYESRPNITIDSISLCLKAGNAVMLVADLVAPRSNKVILDWVHRGMDRYGVPKAAVHLVETDDPEVGEHFSHLTEYVDVLIPRGSPELIRRVSRTATVPIIETGVGNCHVFVERTARLSMAADIAFNAKMQRPGVPNSMETLLVDQAIAREFLPLIGFRMQAAGVELRGCETTRSILTSIKAATDEDWATAYLAPILAVKVVDGLDEAVAHIRKYGTHHSEAIVSSDYATSRRFCERVDAAAVYVNASTRFTDAYEFGLGAELGISTQKLHRRGPLGLRSLTTWKWIVFGDGQVRD